MFFGILYCIYIEGVKLFLWCKLWLIVVSVVLFNVIDFFLCILVDIGILGFYICILVLLL